MKIAFVHCRLLPGWAKNVLEHIIAHTTYNQATIFTLITKEYTQDIQGKSLQVITVFPKVINNFLLRITEKNIPIISTLFDYRNLIVLYPLRSYILSRKIKKYNPDYIYISSFAWSKNINTYSVPTTLYLHSPMQYIRTHYDEYCKKITWWKWIIFKAITPRLRKRDQKPRTYKKIIANSLYTAQEAKNIYNLPTIIQYPHIQEQVFEKPIPKEIHNYFIYTGRLVTFVKELDIIIQACNQTKTPLIIMGDWPDKLKLEKIAGDTIIFIPRIQDINSRIQIIQKAQWFINITKESFGIATMEALLLWVPVLGYNQWATPELVDKDSWILINNKKIETLIEALQQRNKKTYDRITIQKNAEQTYKAHSAHSKINIIS